MGRRRDLPFSFFGIFVFCLTSLGSWGGDVSSPFFEELFLTWGFSSWCPGRVWFFDHSPYFFAGMVSNRLPPGCNPGLRFGYKRSPGCIRDRIPKVPLPPLVGSPAFFPSDISYQSRRRTPLSCRRQQVWPVHIWLFFSPWGSEFDPVASFLFSFLGARSDEDCSCPVSAASSHLVARGGPLDSRAGELPSSGTSFFSFPPLGSSTVGFLLLNLTFTRAKTGLKLGWASRWRRNSPTPPPPFLETVERWALGLCSRPYF